MALPTSGSSDEITELLHACSKGERGAFDQLIPLVYDDLKAIAHKRLALEHPDHTLDTTGLVHEAYLGLVNQATADWQDRTHFFAVSAKVIRHVLVDYARRRNAQKRGAGAIHLPLSDELRVEDGETIELLALDEALSSLGDMDAQLEHVVECRFFGGMSMQDTADAVGMPLRTAERAWRRARAYLYEALI
jgi:RNA polymerase sigma factor (TIGR02999 family)